MSALDFTVVESLLFIIAGGAVLMFSNIVPVPADAADEALMGNGWKIVLLGLVVLACLLAVIGTASLVMSLFEFLEPM